MVLKRQLIALCILTALVSGGVLVRELLRWNETNNYNAAIAAGRFRDAGAYLGEYGLFAQAYAEQEQGRHQEARVIYGTLENTDDKRLRAAVLFNMGNTYLQQVSRIDIEAEADRTSPLIELAKGSYRQLLNLDSQHWDGKYNLERALQLLPDSRDQKLMELDGRRSPVRTIISIDPEGDLP